MYKRQMIHRVGNPGYFRARNYYVREVATGKEVDLNRVTRSMLMSGAYGIAQRGGKGNALGRIIFRFDNNFSVFLHDTNSKGVFGPVSYTHLDVYKRQVRTAP